MGNLVSDMLLTVTADVDTGEGSSDW